MGCWWIDEAPYPGPANSYESLAEALSSLTSGIGKVFHAQFGAYGRMAGKLLAVQDEVANLNHQWNLPPFDPPPFNTGGFVPKPKKPSPMPTHVGPRARRQYDHRGRRRS